jgi:glycosyltransferase involved in cell wall biosynthesis
MTSGIVKGDSKGDVGDGGMKVVHITPYFPPSKGGIARFVSELVQSQSLTEQVQVITREGEASENVSILSGGKGSFILKAIRLLGRIQPDIIHSHSHWHMLVPALIHSKFHENVRVFFTFHTEPADHGMGRKGKVFGKMLSRCDAVTYVSKALKQRISEEIEIRTRQTAIYPGVRMKTVKEGELNEFVEMHRTEGASPLLSFIGLLEWEGKVQGVKMLLEAVAVVRDEHPSLKLLIVGDGSKRREVEERITDLNLSDCVKITGLVENVFVPLTLCDIYVHISLQEGMPQSLLEAMYLGKPVIASKVGGIPEAVENGVTGILVKPEIDAISSAIIDLIGDKGKSARLGENAEKFVRSTFSWENIAQDFRRLYVNSR